MKKILAIGNGKGIQKVFCRNCSTELQQKTKRILYRSVYTVQNYWDCPKCGHKETA